jgi:biopolymer transport protein ExbB/TolQ
MLDSYLNIALDNGFDLLILSLGALLVVLHAIAFLGRWLRRKMFVQRLEYYQSLLLLFTELLPILGLLGTMLALMHTFEGIGDAPEGKPEIAAMIQRFAPALTTTISGLIMVLPNLTLNAFLWLLIPDKARNY